MFIAGNLVSAIAQILEIVLEFFTWVIIARAILSWVNPDPYNPIVQFLYKITEPVLYPVRRAMGKYSGGLDLSPMIVILIIIFLKRFLVGTLFGIAQRLG